MKPISNPKLKKSKTQNQYMKKKLTSTFSSTWSLGGVLMLMGSSMMAIGSGCQNITSDQRSIFTMPAYLFLCQRLLFFTSLLVSHANASSISPLPFLLFPLHNSPLCLCASKDSTKVFFPLIFAFLCVLCAKTFTSKGCCSLM